MKKIVAVLFPLLVLLALSASSGCSGANDITGPGRPGDSQPGDGRSVTPPPNTVTPHPPRNQCRQNPAEC